MSADKANYEEFGTEEDHSITEITDVSTENALQIIETAKSIDPQLFEGLSHSKKQSLARNLAIGISIRSKSHSSPLPDPETLEAYNKIIPDGAERIMKMAENEQNARHDQNSYVSRRIIDQSGTGQILGFILCFLSIGGGIFLSSIGKDTAGIATIIGALVTLAGAFLYTRHLGNKEK